MLFRRVPYLLLFFLLTPSAFAQSVQIGFEPFITGLNNPVYLTNAHDGSNRRFIIEQPGRISVVQPGTTTRTTFLDITSRVIFGGERGLLGLAFHPQFATNRRFFVDYTRQPDGATVIAEYQVSAVNPNVADSTETVLVVIPQPYENHNGGMVEFGPDGYLYIGMGDGGSGNDPQNHAQNPADLLGKIIRIDVDRAPNRAEVYAIGMRNPWRFSFDRATGQLYVGDVGQDVREEVDIITAGGNYGWRVIEGTRCTNLGPASCSTPGFIPPIAEYDHSTNGRCSITGGYVYRGSQQSLPYGSYIYGDYCSGEIFLYQAGVQSLLMDTAYSISSFGEDEAGEIYVVNLGGAIYHITNPGSVNSATRSFTISDRGSYSLANSGTTALSTGYTRVQVDPESALPAGMGIVGYRNRGVLVSETSIPVSPLISAGRVYAEVSGAIRTGIAIANPNGQPVTLTFYFTDAQGNNFGQGSTTIDANQQLAAFLDEPPFNGGSNVLGTFTFTSSALVSTIALRGYTNSFGDFLMATLPVVDLNATPSGVQVIPHFAIGGGWSTTIQLVNPTDAAMTGTIDMYDPGGQHIGSSVPYSLVPRGAFSQGLLNFFPPVNIGTYSVRIVPSSNATPVTSAIFTQTISNVVRTQAAVQGLPAADAFRIFVENLGTFNSAPGSIETGIAVANASSSAANVTLELFGLDGSPTTFSGSISVPANGQAVSFLNQIAGFTSLPARFQGVLRVSSSSPIAVAGLRGRYNERGDFLISTAWAVPETYTPVSSELLIPHFATGDSYETQFVLFSGRAAVSSGVVFFFDKNGNPLTLPFR